MNLMRQEPTLTRILPIIPDELDTTEVRAFQQVDYIYEPDSDAVLSTLLPRFNRSTSLSRLAGEHRERA